MTTVAIPEPSAVAPADVPDLCDAVMATVADLVDISVIDELRKRLSMIDTYLDMTTTEGRGAISATLRRMEVRIGVLLGPAHRGGDQSKSTVNDSLTTDQRSQFRKLAEHADTVEAVINESGDASPASRRKALNAIKELADLEAQEDAIGNVRPMSERPNPPRSDLWDLTALRVSIEEREWTFPMDHHPDVIDELRRIRVALEQIGEQL